MLSVGVDASRLPADTVQVAIDGSKFKAVNNRDRNFTAAKLQRRMQEIEANLDEKFCVRHWGHEMQ